MTDPVAALTGDEELEVDDGERTVPDAPAREPSQEEVSHDAGIEAQMAKKQGPWPSSNRTQVERDAMWRAAPGAEDPVRETEDVSPIPPEAMDDLSGSNPDDMEPQSPARELLEEIKTVCDRASQDLDTVRQLQDELERVSAKARKVAGDDCLVPETLQERLRKSAVARPDHCEQRQDVAEQHLLSKISVSRRPPTLPAIKRAARILKKAEWPTDAPPKGIGLPTEVRPVNQALIDDVNDMAKAAGDWVDQGWWYEKEFKLASNKREPFKTALFLELAGTGERDHQFTTADTDNGVVVKVDRTEKGLNPQFTKMANQVYETFDPSKLPVVQTVEQHKLAGEVKMLIIRKTMVPREDHVCPHCEAVIGEKETFSPEEYRDHPAEIISQHMPCGGLYSQKRMSHQELMERIPGLQPGEWHDHGDCDLNDDPGVKTAADKPFRRRVEVIITDGLNVWGEKKTPQKGGVWFPGGGVDTRGEKFADAAAREVVEESGFEIDEIYRLARIKPCECVWADSVIDQADGKWEEKAKQYRGDRTHLYVATVQRQGDPTSREGDAMPGEWMKFSAAIRKLRNAIPHDNQGWKPLTRSRLRAVEMLAPSGLKVPRRGEIDEVHEGVEDA